MQELTVRPATEADLERLLEIHFSAFPDSRGAAPRRRNFADNPLGALSDLHVALRDGEPVGHAFLFRLGVFFEGTRVPVGGIASVGVAPEARGAGVAGRLMEQLHAESARRGDALTMLYAFRYDFYARFGYARAGVHQRLSIAPRSVPRAWVEAARASGLRAARGGDRPAIEAAYALAVRGGRGAIDRPDLLWDQLLLDERVHTLVLPGAAGLRGFVSFEHLQAEPHAMVRLRVRDLAATDDEARRTLFGALGAQADQATLVEVSLAADDPLALALGDADAHRFGEADLEHTLGVVAGGPMLRVADVSRALGARGWRGDGEANLVVDGAPLRVTVRRGRASVDTTDAGLRVSSATLGAIAFGSLRVRDAVALGLAEGDDDDVARAHELFGGPAFLMRDDF